MCRSLSVSPAFSSVSVCQKSGSVRRTAKVAVCKSSSAGRDTNMEVDRRGLLLSAASVVAGLQAIAAPGPAQAFLGLGEDASAIYTDQTQEVIDGIRGALELSPNTDEREKAMGALKEKTVAWVSRYRRDPKFAGRPSFSQMYSAVNALDGQLVSFGLKANFPAKRLERMMKSVDDAERQLKRGR